MMSRRGGPSVQILLGIAVVGLFLYGFYSYHKVKTGLRLMEEKAERLKVQHESVSAQLQVVYEHKTRLEKAVQEEKAHHKKTKDDLTLEKGTLEEKMRQEKNTLNEELTRIKMEHSKLEDSHQKVEIEKQDLQYELKNFQEKCEQNLRLLKQQSNQQRQECDNDIAQLKDEIADLSRRNAEMETKLQNASLSKGDIVKSIGEKRNKSLNEEQNLMQIAEPGENKRKAYFEVKSPAPEDQRMVNARQLPPVHKEQVAPPVVKSQDTDTGDTKNEGPGAGVAAGAGADAGGEADSDAGRIPNALDNQIKENLGNKSYARNFDDNVIERVRPVAPEGVREERNPDPVQVPAPAPKESEGAINQPGRLAGAGADDLVHRERAFRRSRGEVPGHILNAGNNNPDANVADEEGEDERAQNEEQVEEENEEQVKNPESKQKMENEQDDYNNINQARDM